jgi:hypothetical protein
MEGKDPIQRDYSGDGGGRPPRLTAEVKDIVLAAIRNHQRVEVAAELAGTDRGTFYGWLRVGADAKVFLSRGGSPQDLTEHQQMCLDLSREISLALAQAEAVAVRSIVNAGLQRQTRRKSVKKAMGLDEHNQPIYATDETVYDDPPDPKNVQWWLSRRLASVYQDRQALEVTGADGGPVALSFAQQLDEIAAKIKGDAIPAASTETPAENDES